MVGIAIVLLIVGVITGGLYYYLSKQIPEVPEITGEPAEEEIVKPEEATPLPEQSSPQVYFSSNKLEQGDTLLIKIADKSAINEVSGEFELVKIDFFKLATLEDWVGIVGIDVRKEPGQYNLVINFSDGRKIKKELNIVERKFPITELLVTKELEEKGLTPSKIVGNIVTKENPALKEVLAVYTEISYFNQAFIYPLEKIKVVGAFGNIRKSGEVGAQHLGIDLEAGIGTPVYAVNNGVVRFSQELTTYGKTLIIDHGFGIFSLYLHLNEFKVLSGEKVKQRDIIGFSGNTGYSIEPHLHFSVKINGSNVDPLRFIDTIDKEIIK